MKEINLEVNIMKPEDNRAIIRYVADNLICYANIQYLAMICKQVAIDRDFLGLMKED